MDIVRVLKDVNLNVVSAEVDTIGTQTEDEFFVTYRVGQGLRDNHLTNRDSSVNS